MISVWRWVILGNFEFFNDLDYLYDFIFSYSIRTI